MLLYTFWEWWFILLGDSGEEDSLDETFEKVGIKVSVVVEYGVCSDVFVYACYTF